MKIARAVVAAAVLAAATTVCGDPEDRSTLAVDVADPRGDLCCGTPASQREGSLDIRRLVVTSDETRLRVVWTVDEPIPEIMPGERHVFRLDLQEGSDHTSLSVILGDGAGVFLSTGARLAVEPIVDGATLRVDVPSPSLAGMSGCDGSRTELQRPHETGFAADVSQDEVACQ